MEDQTWIIIVALLVLAFIICFALALGINGTALATGLAIVGACVGYGAKTVRGT